MAGTVIVDSEDCTLHDVILTIRNAQPRNFSILTDKWSNLAMSLNIGSASIKELRLKKLHDKLNLEGVILEVIEEWVGNATDDTTLDVLARALEGVGAKSYADALKNRFAPSTTTPPQQQQQHGKSSTATDPDAFKNFIRQNQLVLVERTMMYPGVLAYLNSVEVLGDDDEAHLKSIRNDSERTREFYKIMQKRGNDCCNHLLKAFKEQRGVLDILLKFREGEEG